MNAVGIITGLVDREIGYWRRPVISLLAALVPIAVLDIFFEGKPADLPLSFLLPALVTAAIWAIFVMWRYVRFEIHEFKRLRTLAVEENTAIEDGRA